MAIQPLAGKFGKVRWGIDGGPLIAQLICDSWDVSINVEAIDTTNSGSYGWHDNIAGIYKADYTLSGPIVRDPTTGVLDVYPTEGTIVLVEVSNDPDGALPYANLYKDEILVTSVKKTLSVKGKYEFEISGTSTVSGNTYTI